MYIVNKTVYLFFGTFLKSASSDESERITLPLLFLRPALGRSDVLFSPVATMSKTFFNSSSDEEGGGGSSDMSNKISLERFILFYFV